VFRVPRNLGALPGLWLPLCPFSFLSAPPWLFWGSAPFCSSLACSGVFLPLLFGLFPSGCRSFLCWVLTVPLRPSFVPFFVWGLLCWGVPCFTASGAPKVLRRWGVLCFLTSNVRRATTACNFSPLIPPNGFAPAALASLLLTLRSHKTLEKHSVLGLFYFFMRLHFFFWPFLWSIFFPPLFFVCPYFVGNLTS
jgi:hypothetical protein